jgi:hypothetical protein
MDGEEYPKKEFTIFNKSEINELRKLTDKLGIYITPGTDDSLINFKKWDKRNSDNSIKLRYSSTGSRQDLRSIGTIIKDIDEYYYIKYNEDLIYRCDQFEGLIENLKMYKSKYLQTNEKNMYKFKHIKYFN